MAKVLLTVKLDPRHATVSDVCARLGLERHGVDEHFGVVSIDPEADLYAVLVEESASNDAAATDGDVHGPYANPGIEPLGP